MYREKSIAVVVPVYNEEKLIVRTIETMPGFVDVIIVVDDHSRDHTPDVVKGHEQKMNGRLVLLCNEKNRGVGGAIIRGYQKAIKEGYDIVAVMAGDAQMDPDDLAKVLDPVVEGKADYAKGNRLSTGDAWKIIPRMRYLGNSVLSLMTKMASGYWHVTDSQSGYTAISLKALKMLPLERIYKRYGMPNDMLIHLSVNDLRVRDVPVRPVYNIGEKSGIVLAYVIPKISWLLTKGFFWRIKEKYIIRDFHPMVFFYIFGVFATLTGLLFGLQLLVIRLSEAHVATTSALFATILLITGLQSLFFAMWMDMEHNRALHSQG